MQGVLTSLLLPPLGLVLLGLAAGLLALRRAPLAGTLSSISAALLLVLATPFAAGTLRAGLTVPRSDTTLRADAVVVLGAEQRRGAAGPEIGPLTLERLRAGAAVARTENLPLLVTGGPLSTGSLPIAELMAASLAADFGLPTKWVEPRAANTRENAVYSAALLQAEGISTVHVVSHAWHLPRALAAFRRAGITPLPAPVRQEYAPDGIVSDFLPRPDHLAESWLMLRELAGLLVYRLRDGPTDQPVPAALPAVPGRQ